MAFDALTLHAIRDELARTIIGGYVARVALAAPHRLSLTVYAQRQRRHLLVSVDPADARLHLATAPLPLDPAAVPPFLLLLRKYVREGRIEAIEQPYLERVLSIVVAKRLESGARHVRLIIEIMGRRSNAVLVDEDDAILDALRRASPAKNPERPLLPHLRYSPPPPQHRLDPLADSTIARLRDEALASSPVPLVDLLGSRLAGCSPQLAREIAWRASGSLQSMAGPATDWRKLRAVLDDLFAPLCGGAWQPCVAWQGERPVACAPYHLTHLTDATLQAFASMSQAIETCSRVEAPAARPGGSVASARQAAAPLAAAIARQRSQLERKQASLRRALDEAGRADQLREAGQAILACANLAEGQAVLEWQGQRIALDPTCSPVENAQRYFREYRKARDAARQVPELLRKATAQLAYLDQMAALLEAADDAGQVRAIKAELRESGLLGESDGQGASSPRRRQPDGRPRNGPAPLHVTTAEGFDILVGTSARSNERVTFELAQPDDIWLHARGAAGAHVVVRTTGRPLPPTVLELAARLAASRSTARLNTRVAVDWTLRRHVRRQRGGPPGLVTYTHEQTIVVEPSAPSFIDQAPSPATPAEGRVSRE